MYVCMYVCMYFVCMYAYVCMYACVCVCMCVLMYVEVDYTYIDVNALAQGINYLVDNFNKLTQMAVIK